MVIIYGNKHTCMLYKLLMNHYDLKKITIGYELIMVYWAKGMCYRPHSMP